MSPIKPISGGIFSDTPIIFGLFFSLIILIVVIAVIAGIVHAIKNSAEPIITIEARVIAKRTEVTSQQQVGENNILQNSSVTHYYITFETERKDRLEFPVGGRMYGLLIEGDEGSLTYQGEWFMEFKRHNKK